MGSTSIGSFIFCIAVFLPFTTAAFEVLHVCENEAKSITCDEGIEVISARYGRFDKVTCPHTAMSLVGCGSDGVLADITSKCAGKITCTLSATTAIYGDPCKGTYKYLEVNYSCPSAAPVTTTMTEVTTTTTEAETTTPEVTKTTTEAETTTTPEVTTTTTEVETTTTTDLKTTTTTALETSSVATNAMCSCCVPLNMTSSGCASDDVNCMITAVKKELAVDKQTLSSTIRKKTSANDDRPSAQAIGLVGVAVLVAFALIVVVPDIVALCRYMWPMPRKPNVP